MKVLENPRLKFGGWSHIVGCAGCLSKLEIFRDDVKHQPATGGNPHDFCEERFYVTCKVCKKQINIPESDLGAALALFIKGRPIA